MPNTDAGQCSKGLSTVFSKHRLCLVPREMALPKKQPQSHYIVLSTVYLCAEREDIMTDFDIERLGGEFEVTDLD